MLSRYCWHWLILKFSSVSVCCQLQILSPVFGLQRPIDLISVFTQEIHLSTPVCTLTFTSAFKCHVDIDKSEIIDAICDICMHSVAGNIWDICLSYWFDVVYHGSDGTQWKTVWEIDACGVRLLLEALQRNLILEMEMFERGAEMKCLWLCE